ncbi:hypothetical protein MP228_011115 [Amoeboaphelidium protococcarum]|nr:hypothetical protein MP228_011115 [Amoeboaphelidium protococcarum]
MFDIKQYAELYQGIAKVRRLLHIAQVCELPGDKCTALRIVLEELKREDNYIEYEKLYSEYQSLVKQVQQADGGSSDDSLQLKHAQTHHSRRIEATMKLRQDLAQYRQNLIKESIRMGYVDLAQHLLSNCLRYIEDGSTVTGGDGQKLHSPQLNLGGDILLDSGSDSDFTDGASLLDVIKCFIKAKEYCTSMNKVLECYMYVVFLALEGRCYDLSSSYAQNLEQLLEKDTNMNSNVNSSSGDQSAVGDDKVLKMRVNCMAVKAISHLGQGEFTKSLSILQELLSFMQSHNMSITALNSDELSLKRSSSGGSVNRNKSNEASVVNLDSLYAPIVSYQDIGLYVVILTLITCGRQEWKLNILENQTVKMFLDAEPALIELVELCYEFNVQQAMALFDKQLSFRIKCDLFLCQLMGVIQQRLNESLLVLYVEQCSKVKLDSLWHLFMPGSDGLDPMLQLLWDLIHNQKLRGYKIDEPSGVLYKSNPDCGDNALNEKQSLRGGVMNQFEQCHRLTMLKLELQKRNFTITPQD